MPRKAVSSLYDDTPKGKPFVLKTGFGEPVREYDNRHAAHIRMRELGGNHYVWSRLEKRIIFSPLDMH